ncbi:MAG TPA: SPOR domain-containing protein [Puia sp.]|nr:SPOR domain-containing protein [Puia sp.]
MYKFLFISLLFLGQRSWAQTDTSGVVVTKDPRIDMLVRRQIAANDLATRESRRNVPGFRIQVMNTPDRNKIYDAKAKVYEQFPDWKPYVLYQAPNYKLRVGDFKTEEEADSALQQIQQSKLFPDGIYVIHAIIELKLSDLATPPNP